MKRKALTWQDLADKINQMSSEEKKELVKVGGSELPLCNNVVLDKENEDLCYDADEACGECDPRSWWDDRTNLGVALKANTYYLNSY